MENPIIYDLIYELYISSVKNQINIFKNEYLSEFEKNGISVFFIDSWDKITSIFLQEDSEINKRTIPLIGSDGNLYKSWQDWQSTLEKPYIINNYPKTSNHHPTPEIHKLISESLIRLPVRMKVKSFLEVQS